MELQFNGRFGAGNDLLDADLRDLQITGAAGGMFLYAATGQNGGIAVYRVDGNAPVPVGARYYTTSGIAMGRVDLIGLDGAARLVTTGTGDGELLGYDITTTGALGGPVRSDLPAGGTQTAVAVATRALGNGKTALYMVDGDSGRLAGYVSDGAGTLATETALAGRDAAYGFDGNAILRIAQTGTKAFLLAADGAGAQLRAFRIDGDSGALRHTGSLGAGDGLGIAAPAAMETVTAHGATWVVLAATGSSTLSVMRLRADGGLEPAEHITDTAATRFGGVAALATVSAQGRVFVLAGGADDGLALFSLLADGRLVHMQSLAHSTGAGLANITAIEAFEQDGEIRIFVASGGDTGISRFSLPLASLGSVVQDTGAQNRLAGQGGDDILVSGAGGGTLTGGAGRDIFVLGPADAPLRIADFEPGLDRLDMTRFAMLRGVEQLDLASTATGIDIAYRGTEIRITSRDATPLTAADLWPAGFDTPDWNPVPAGPVIRVTRGSAGDDILELGAGRDRVHGLAGEDLLRGGAGADRLFGGTGTDRLLGGRGNDHLSGGAGNDILRGGAGEGRDTLRGRGGNDTLRGGGGDDLLLGGAGRDTFVFSDRDGAGHGNDRIGDFTPGRDLIRLDIIGADFAALELRAQGQDTLLDTGAGTITLTGIQPAELSADDFLFS